MREEHPSHPAKAVKKTVKPARRTEYCVPPLLVDDLVTQCAAHFLAAFTTNASEHVRGVLKCGINGAGGLRDEVTYWFDQCANDASMPENNNGFWDVDVNGPWTYDLVALREVVKAVRYHTMGWSPANFMLYGVTVEENTELDGVRATFK